MARLDDLAETTGLDRSRLAFLDDADDAEVAALVDSFRAARAGRDAELRRAVDRALSFVPRPLRGRVRRLMGGGGRG